MYWNKAIIASLVASTAFARPQRLGGPELRDHNMVSEGKVFEDAGNNVVAEVVDGQIGSNDSALDASKNGAQHNIIQMNDKFSSEAVSSRYVNTPYNYNI